MIFFRDMKTEQISLPVPEDALRLLRALREAGYTAYICGGWVRDALLGHIGTESKGMDLVTSAPPDEVARVAESLGYKPRFVGKTFGITLVGGFEVATFRTDKSYSDGRHPDAVEFGVSPEEDAKRRDFTINALFYDPFDGVVIDYVGGLEDLRAKRLRFIGDPHRRLAEDRLRAIRYVRFIGTLGEEWSDTDSLEAIKAMSGDIVPRLAWERIADEISRMLEGPRPDVCMEYLRRLGLLKDILPELEATYTTQGGDYHAETVYEHSLICARRAREFLDDPPYSGRPPSRRAMFVFACLLHDIGKAPAARLVACCPSCRKRNVKTFEEAGVSRCSICGAQVELDWAFYGHERLGAKMVERIARRFKLSTKDTQYLVALTKHHMVTITPDKVIRRCQSCGFEFSSWDSVVFHRLPEDVRKGAIRCPRCGSTDTEVKSIRAKGTSLAAVRRLVVRLGKELAWDLLLLRWADILSNLKEDERGELSGHLFAAMYDEVVSEMERFRIADLAIGGKDLIELGLKPGPLFGEILEHLKDRILDDPSRNNRDWLIGEVKRYLAQRKANTNGDQGVNE